MMGAAWATLICCLLMALLQYSISARFYVVSYEWWRIAKLIVTGTALYVVLQVVRIEGIVAAVVVKGLLWASFPLLLFVIGFYQSVEKQNVKEFQINYQSETRFGEEVQINIRNASESDPFEYLEGIRASDENAAFRARFRFAAL